MTAVDLLQKVRTARPLVADLARALSLAAHIDVALTRNLRRALFERADVTTEADLWSSPLVQTRSGREIALRGDVQTALWDELAARPEELERCWAALENLRPPGRPLRHLEEHLTYLAIKGDRDEIESQLRAVVKAMLDDPTRRRDLSAWSARALARLPAVVRDCEAARILGAAASGWVATPASVASLAPMPENVRLADQLRADDKRVAVTIRRIGDVLEVGGTPGPPAVGIDLAVANPILIVDEDRTVRIDLGGVTRIPVARPQVMIGTSDGRRWLLGPEQARPSLFGVAPLSGAGGLGAAYLVAPTLAVTSAQLVSVRSPDSPDSGPGGAWTGMLQFGTLPIAAKAIALDDDADLALLELASPAFATPLLLRSDVAQGEPWQAFALPPGGTATPGPADTARSWKGTVASAWPGLALRLAVDEVPERLNRPGMPVFSGDKVIGHLKGERPRDGVLAVTSARVVAWWIATATAVPRATPVATTGATNDATGRKLGVIARTGSSDEADALKAMLAELDVDIIRVEVGELVADDIDLVTSILDVTSFRDGWGLAIELVRSMIELVQDPIEARDLFQRVGLELDVAALDQARLARTWPQILATAASTGRTRALVAAVRDAHPDSPRASFLESLLARQPRDVLALAFRTQVSEEVLAQAAFAGVQVHPCHTLVEARVAVLSLMQTLAGAPAGLEANAPSPGIRGSSLGRVWIQSKRSEDVPVDLTFQAAGDIQFGEYVLLFVGEGDRRWPAALYAVASRRRGAQRIQQKAGPAGTEVTCQLLLRLARPPVELLRANADEIRKIADVTSQRDTRNLHIHDQLVDLVWRLNANTPEGEQITTYLGSPRRSQTQKTLPVLLQLPEWVSTAGLFGTETASEGGIRRFAGYRWGEHAITVVVGNQPWLAAPGTLRVRIAETEEADPARWRELDPVLWGSNDDFARACRTAAERYVRDSVAPGVEPGDVMARTGEDSGPSDFDLELFVHPLSKQPRAHAVRRAVQFVIEMLHQLDAGDQQPHRLYLQVPGCGEHDIAEVPRRVRTVDGLTLLSIDPGADLVELAARDSGTESQQPQLEQIAAALGGPIARQFSGESPDDLIAGRFGWARVRSGRVLDVEVRDGAAHAQVTGDASHHPLRGYVTFYYPTDFGIVGRSRVRAQDGVATIALPPYPDDHAIGAIVEDEGILLEHQVWPGPDPAPAQMQTSEELA